MFYFVHQIFSLLIYSKQKLSNQITQTKVIFKPLIKNIKKLLVAAWWWWEASMTKVVAP